MDLLQQQLEHFQLQLPTIKTRVSEILLRDYSNFFDSFYLETDLDSLISEPIDQIESILESINENQELQPFRTSCQDVLTNYKLLEALLSVNKDILFLDSISNSYFENIDILQFTETLLSIESSLPPLLQDDPSLENLKKCLLYQMKSFRSRFHAFLNSILNHHFIQIKSSKSSNKKIQYTLTVFLHSQSSLLARRVPIPEVLTACTKLGYLPTFMTSLLSSIAQNLLLPVLKDPVPYSLEKTLLNGFHPVLVLKPLPVVSMNPFITALEKVQGLSFFLCSQVVEPIGIQEVSTLFTQLWPNFIQSQFTLWFQFGLEQHWFQPPIPNSTKQQDPKVTNTHGSASSKTNHDALYFLTSFKDHLQTLMNESLAQPSLLILFPISTSLPLGSSHPSSSPSSSSSSSSCSSIPSWYSQFKQFALQDLLLNHIKAETFLNASQTLKSGGASNTISTSVFTEEVTHKLNKFKKSSSTASSSSHRSFPSCLVSIPTLSFIELLKTTHPMFHRSLVYQFMAMQPNAFEPGWQCSPTNVAVATNSYLFLAYQLSNLVQSIPSDFLVTLGYTKLMCSGLDLIPFLRKEGTQWLYNLVHSMQFDLSRRVDAMAPLCNLTKSDHFNHVLNECQEVKNTFRYWESCWKNTLPYSLYTSTLSYLLSHYLDAFYSALLLFPIPAYLASQIKYLLSSCLPVLPWHVTSQTKLREVTTLLSCFSKTQLSTMEFTVLTEPEVQEWVQRCEFLT